MLKIVEIRIAVYQQWFIRNLYLFEYEQLLALKIIIENHAVSTIEYRHWFWHSPVLSPISCGFGKV